MPGGEAQVSERSNILISHRGLSVSLFFLSHSLVRLRNVSRGGEGGGS